MPQLDTLSFASQLFWLLISFSILCFLMYKKIVPSISSVLQARQDTISNDLEMAEKLNEEAKEIEEFYKESLRVNRAKAAKITAKSAADIEIMREKEFAIFNQKIDKISAEADAKLQESSRLVIEETNLLAAELSLLIVDKLAGVKVTKAKATAAVNQVCKENNFGI